MICVAIALFACLIGQVYPEDADDKTKFMEAELNFMQDKSLREWKAPESFEKGFLYYLSGHDDDGRPIWITEFGKWDLKKVFEGGEEILKEFDHYVDQLIVNVLESLQLESHKNDEDAPGEVVAVIDMDGYNLAQLASVPSMSYVLKRLSQLEPIANKRLHSAYVINANFVAERFINLIRPAVGGIMQRVEVFGAQKSQWMPKILKSLPKDQLPQWYGGEEGYKPRTIFG